MDNFKSRRVQAIGLIVVGLLLFTGSACRSAARVAPDAPPVSATPAAPASTVKMIIENTTSKVENLEVLRVGQFIQDDAKMTMDTFAGPSGKIYDFEAKQGFKEVGVSGESSMFSKFQDSLDQAIASSGGDQQSFIAQSSFRGGIEKIVILYNIPDAPNRIGITFSNSITRINFDLSKPEAKELAHLLRVGA